MEYAGVCAATTRSAVEIVEDRAVIGDCDMIGSRADRCDEHERDCRSRRSRVPRARSAGMQSRLFQNLRSPAFTGSNLMREGAVNIIKRKSSFVQSSSRATSMMAANAAAVGGP